ncbi:hypothetical protein KEJ32_05125, partial [Candidatus Bathyarchaeota archaeon]|nr:hypothetical protein [Candidatus Bathyarchaeota archaeon]
MSKKYVDTLNEFIESLIGSFQKNNVSEFLAYLLKLRGVIGDIIQKLFPEETYESIRRTFTIPAYVKAQNMSKQ